MATYIWKSEYFFGNKVSDYGLKNGYIDYGTLAKAFDCILNNEIMQATNEVCGYWEPVSGYVDNYEKICEKEDELDNLNFCLANREEDIESFEYILANPDEYPHYYYSFSELLNLKKEIEENKKEIADLKEEIAEVEEEIKELEEEDNSNAEIFQWYIISGNGATILEDYTNEIIYYNNELDLYLWGVTHFGTSWDYVLTDIKIELDEQED